MKTNPLRTVVAGGGLVVDDQGRFLLVHRPRYDDWSFPKGKLDAGETIEECAIREVHEESGFVCELGDRAATIHYVDHKGRDKDVHYWWMRPVDGSFEPNDEVDEIEWLAPADVPAKLSYARDVDALGQAVNGL